MVCALLRWSTGDGNGLVHWKIPQPAVWRPLTLQRDEQESLSSQASGTCLQEKNITKHAIKIQVRMLSSVTVSTLTWGKDRLFSSHSLCNYWIFRIKQTLRSCRGFPGGSVVKNPPANAGDAGDTGSIPGSGRFPRGGNGNPLQQSCLENPMDRGAWWATVHGVAKSQT